MKNKRVYLLLMVCLAGLFILGSTTAQAKVVKVDFAALEYIYPPAGVFMPPTVWVSDGGVVHWDDAMFPFVVYGDIEGVLQAGITRMNINPVTGIGHAIGTNSFIGIWMIEGDFYGAELIFEGVSIMVQIDGKISGEAVSHGTLGGHKILFQATFTPAEVGLTLIQGTLTIHL
ncbi:MAG: hypothetical protein GOP50_12220 [Candidatus Heimdallarchaeota archaeon]|nr:hypothetical protein [Candidatus Heimdallarchaeota archaeon]